MCSRGRAGSNPAFGTMLTPKGPTITGIQILLVFAIIVGIGVMSYKVEIKHKLDTTKHKIIIHEYWENFETLPDSDKVDVLSHRLKNLREYIISDEIFHHNINDSDDIVKLKEFIHDVEIGGHHGIAHPKILDKQK